MRDENGIIRNPVQSFGFEGTRWFGQVQRGGCWNINEDESYSNVRDNASADFDLGGFVGLRPVRNAKANG